MNVSEFQQVLRSKGCYETPRDRCRSAFDRMAGGWTVWYYAKLAAVTVEAHRIARAGRYDLAAWSRSSFRVVQAVEESGSSVSISGLEERAKIPGPVVYASNHMSMLETFVLPCILLSFGDVAVVVKNKLLDYPLFGVILRSVRPIAIGRENPRADLETVLAEGTRAIAAGRSVLVFPQATRRSDFDEAEFNSLGCKLARRAGVPVVPVALKTDFQGVGSLIRDFGPIDASKSVHFRFGTPLVVAGQGRETHRQVVAFIGSTLREWGVRVLQQASSASGEGAAEERRT